MIHMLDTTIYSSVVMRETVHIALTMAVLNDLEIKEADVLNIFVTAPNRKKKRIELGPEFGDDAGKSAINVRVLHSLKSACASFMAHLPQCMLEFGYQSCDADHDLCMKTEHKPEDK